MPAPRYGGDAFTSARTASSVSVGQGHGSRAGADRQRRPAGARAGCGGRAGRLSRRMPGPRTDFFQVAGKLLDVDDLPAWGEGAAVCPEAVHTWPEDAEPLTSRAWAHPFEFEDAARGLVGRVVPASTELGKLMPAPASRGARAPLADAWASNRCGWTSPPARRRPTTTARRERGPGHPRRHERVPPRSGEARCAQWVRRRGGLRADEGGFWGDTDSCQTLRENSPSTRCWPGRRDPQQFGRGLPRGGAPRGHPALRSPFPGHFPGPAVEDGKLVADPSRAGRSSPRPGVRTCSPASHLK
jgi:hypothetical protein